MDDIQSPRTGEQPGATAPPKPKGGARPGAGRPPKVDREAIQRAKEEAASRTTGAVIAQIEEAEHLATIAEVEARIGTKALALVDRLVELADGVQVRETDRHGETKTYTRPPDRDACRYLLDRFMGRIPDRAEMLPKTEGEDDRAKLPTPDQLLHEVVRMLLAMQRQQAGPGAAPGADGSQAQSAPLIEAPAPQAESEPQAEGVATAEEAAP